MSTASVKCPTCGRTIEWSRDNPYRPFCSERCKLIDLGAWFTEQRAIPGDAPPPDEDSTDSTPPSGPTGT
ncbi:MAG TPA: DNA gyrase inhibitor YacG [Steroidobacteraceae bacterium]|nr:DNA gyrase inhibitor YacG [Steroidobacteraceae bacterium]